MTDIKKIGLSALAGSLVAFSANAGELSVSGGAKMSYTADTGNEDVETDGNRIGVQKSISFSGSGELDNGHTVSLTHNMAAGGGLSTSIITYDMGAMGSLSYQEADGQLGIGKIDDLMPTADEEVTNGIDTGASSNETPVGKVGPDDTGFNYTYKMDMVQIDAGYSPSGNSINQDDGANEAAGASKSSTSVAVRITPMDGLMVFAGTGEDGTATTTDDETTYGFTYSMGPVSVGAQYAEIDYAAADSDLETQMYGIAFAVNDNLSISYGEQETEKDGSTIDQEVSGFSVGYSMGGISIKAHKNKGENIANEANNESEHTEIALSFAF